MKLKNILLSISVLAVFCTVAFGQSISVQAAQTTTPLYLGITELMSNNTPYMGYSIGDPNANTSTSITAAKIWNIVKYSNSSGSNPTDSAIYCLKAGVGFSDTKKSETYNVYYDMKTEQTAIANQNTVLSGIVNGGHYNEILALLDLFYVKGESDASYKNELLKTANVYVSDDWEDEWDVILNEDDVKAIQQAALWYFTNNENTMFDKTDKTGWLYYTLASKQQTNGSYEYSALSSYNLDTQEGRQKSTQAEILYKYLVKTAKDNATSASDSSAGQPVVITEGKITYEESGSNYVFGPINTTKANNTPFTINMAISCGSTNITNYTLLDESKNTTNKSVHDLMGTNFYISIPKTSVTSMEDLKIDFNGSYNTTTLTLWGSSTNNSAQPVVIPKKESKPIEATLTPSIPDNKEFDLALRKYIIKVNGTPVNNTRVPNIDVTPLTTNSTTASYKHRKDPVTVEENDTITYKLTIYNEGEKAGRATQVTDQLPEGLEFVSVDSGNFERESYDTTTNKLVLKRNNGNNTNLSAYTSGEPKSETIEITCKVTAKPDTSKNKVLTNIAWISQAIDEENKTVDRDSQTSTSPNQTSSELVTENNGYTGNNNKEVLTDSEYYYKGQQDDDDFEKIVLLPESFDLKLTKRITQVNGSNVPERIKSVDVSKLNTLGSNGELVTTGDYNLDKNAVKVKKGDIVTYTFRIYNEGTIDGYASEITEDIPEGLEFLWSEKTGTELRNDTTLTNTEKEAIEYNQNRLWTYADTSLNTIKTTYLSKANETTANGNLLKAFGRNDGTKTANDISSKEVSVKLKVVSEAAAGTIIRNEAAITEDTDKDGNTIDDRDSRTDRWVKYEDDEDYDNIVLDETPEFDLALRKFIIAVSKDTTIDDNEYLKNSDSSYTRAPAVDTSKLNTTTSTGELITTAEYNHKKEPVIVEKNDIVVYMLRVYNEGEVDGYAAEIKDHLPPYLEFVEGEFNNQYGWEKVDDRTIKTTYLSTTDKKINKIATNSNGTIVLNYKEVPIMCKVKETALENQKITNIADITKYLDENTQVVEDRDSDTIGVNLPSDSSLPSYKDNETGSYIPGQQDDDDFEKVIIISENEEFDLKLIKRITEVNGKTVPERIQNIDVSKLNRTRDSEGKLSETTADYKLNKEPVKVKQGDIVTYTFRVYNEGTIDGYASEITEDVPEGLEFIWAEDTSNLSDEEKSAVEYNKNYAWGNFVYDGDRIVQLSTDYLSKAKETSEQGNLIKAFGINNGTKTANDLSYKEVSVKMKVVAENLNDSVIRNEAAVTKDTDKNGNEVDDRDSSTDNWVKYEDDEDYDRIILEPAFDLALRKFIVAVSEDTTIEDGEYLKNSDGTYTREPVVDTSKLNTKDENGKLITTATYTHTKEPILVKKNDIVVYMLRVYNEGEVDGYAAEIKDHLPPYLEFVEGEFNKKYRWDVSEDGRTVTTSYLEDELIKKPVLNKSGITADEEETHQSYTLSYEELPIMCKVKDTAKTNENITNIADITKYLDEDKNDVEDRDSDENNVKLPDDKDLPGYNKSQEDDDDFEKIIVKEFDLALRKWVTQAIVIENGKQSVKNTGHKPYDDPEQVVKVELNRKKLSAVTVKFKYSIRVINEGDVEGYAKEVTDYIPQGLKFVAADNPNWKDEGNNIISTRQLENKLLKPGEYADVEVVLTWINGQDNMGVKTNIAEISEDYNKYRLPDRDSTPDNKKSGEDDIDDAPVMLSISTGQVRIFFTLGFVVLITIAGGVTLIKKYVL